MSTAIVKAGPSDAIVAASPTPPPRYLAAMVKAAEVNAIAVMSHEVTDPLSHKWAVDTLEYCAANLKTFEEERKAATGPILEGVERVRSWFRPAEQALKAAESHLRKTIAAYDSHVKAHNLKALSSPTVAMIPRVDDARVRTVEELAIEITDREAVPRELCIPDEARIKQFHGLYPDVVIPGVKITKVAKTVRVGGKRK